MDFIDMLSVPRGILPMLEEREDMGPFVYFIRHGDCIKVGTSINPAARLRQLSRVDDKTLRPLALGTPELVACIPGSVRHEREWHRRFASKRIVGEWFVIDDELISAVSEAWGVQLSIEMQMAGSAPGSEEAKAIFFRRFSQLERLTDDEYRDMYDSGELDQVA